MSEKQALNKISEEIIAMTAVRAALSVPGVNQNSGQGHSCQRDKSL